MWEQLSTLTEKDAQNIIVLVKSPCQLSLLLSFLYWHPDLWARPSINTLVSKFRSGNSSGHVAFWRCVQKMTHTIFRRRVYIMKQAIFQKEKEKNTFFFACMGIEDNNRIIFSHIMMKMTTAGLRGPPFWAGPQTSFPLYGRPWNNLLSVIMILTRVNQQTHWQLIVWFTEKSPENSHLIK